MFEVGKLTDESLDSFINELSKVSDLNCFASCEGCLMSTIYRLDHKQKEKLRDILNMQ